MEMEPLQSAVLPVFDMENLSDILKCIRDSASDTVPRECIIQQLTRENGAYISKLFNFIELCDLAPDLQQLHALFEVIYAILELCDRSILEILLSHENFFPLVEILGYNPGLLAPINFREELESSMHFKQVIVIDDPTIQEHIHANYRIYVIKENLLVRMLPENVMGLLDQIRNDNNLSILAYLAENEEYWKTFFEILADESKRMDALGLLRETILLLQSTWRVDASNPRKIVQVPSVFGPVILKNLFADGRLFRVFAGILGSHENAADVEMVTEVLQLLIAFEGPARLRTYLATEGKKQALPLSDQEELKWEQDSSLFTALLIAFERLDSSRSQISLILKEILRVTLGQDDSFLNVLYPTYMNWLLQPLKYLKLEESNTEMFGLPEKIMELLTFCTATHGYRIKYLFGRQPVAKCVKKMLSSENKHCVLQGVKFIKSCVLRKDVFFYRFLIMNDLIEPACALLGKKGNSNSTISSAVLNLLSSCENLPSLVEYIYKILYKTYKHVCPLVFESIRMRYDGYNSTKTFVYQQPVKASGAVRLLYQDQPSDSESLEEDLFWEQDEAKAHPSTAENSPSLNSGCITKLVDYDDDDEPQHTETVSDVLEEPETDLKLPVRVEREECETFFAGRPTSQSLLKRKSPAVKNMFKKISWKSTSNVNASETGDEGKVCDSKTENEKTDPTKPCSPDMAPQDTCESNSDALHALIHKKRSQEEHAPQSGTMKKAKKLGT